MKFMVNFQAAKALPSSDNGLRQKQTPAEEIPTANAKLKHAFYFSITTGSAGTRPANTINSAAGPDSVPLGPTN
jgi:hypothetical protein